METETPRLLTSPYRCDGCRQDSARLVEVGEPQDFESSTAILCESCVKKALALFPAAAPNRSSFFGHSRFIRFIKAALIAATSGLSAAAPAAIPPTPPARILSTEDIEIREDKDQGLFDYLYWRELTPEEKAESHASFEAWLAQSEDAVMQQVRPEEINRCR